MLEWIAEYYQVISVVFGCCAAVLAVFKLGHIILRSLIRFIEHEQRNKGQAEFFDRNYQEIKEMRDDIALLKENYAANNGRRIN